MRFFVEAQIPLRLMDLPTFKEMCQEMNPDVTSMCRQSASTASLHYLDIMQSNVILLCYFSFYLYIY